MPGTARYGRTQRAFPRSLQNWSPSRVGAEWRGVARRMAWGGIVNDEAIDIYGTPATLNDPANETRRSSSPWGRAYEMTGTLSGDESISWRGLPPRAVSRIDAIRRYYTVVVVMAGSTTNAWECFFSVDRHAGSGEIGPFLRRAGSTTALDFKGGYNGSTDLAGFSFSSAILSDGLWHVYVAVRRDQTAILYRDGVEIGRDTSITNDADAYAGTPIRGIVFGNYRYHTDTGTHYQMAGGALFDAALSRAEVARLSHDFGGPFRMTPRVVVPASGGGGEGATIPHLASRIETGHQAHGMHHIEAGTV